MDDIKSKALPAKKPTRTEVKIPSMPLELPKPVGGVPQNTPKKSRRWLWWVVVPVGIILIIGAALLGTLWWYNDALQPRSSSAEAVKVVIEPGASVDQVTQELQQKQVIKNSFAMSTYMRLNGKNTIKTGTYYFAPNQSVADIVGWLNEGKVGVRSVTILPGQTLKQIRQSLIDDGFTAEAVDAALTKTYDHPLLADKPAGASLEGYIFPETYFTDADSTPEQIITRSFDEFEKRIEADGSRQKLAARGFTLYQGITLASIIAKEVTNAQDQLQVSQVFQSRLAINMELGSDVTYHYAADQLGVEPAVNLDSPYNTRLYKGLPPGPISNFNFPALQAVENPAAGDYLYFVAGDDGVTHYAKTIEEHEQNIKQYCQKLCQNA